MKATITDTRTGEQTTITLIDLDDAMEQLEHIADTDDRTEAQATVLDAHKIHRGDTGCGTASDMIDDLDLLIEKHAALAPAVEALRWARAMVAPAARAEPFGVKAYTLVHTTDGRILWRSHDGSRREWCSVSADFAKACADRSTLWRLSRNDDAGFEEVRA